MIFTLLIKIKLEVITLNHEVDLKNTLLRTDLAVELIKSKPTKQIDDIKITNITLNEKEANQINKKPGNYITIEFEDVTDSNNQKKLIKIFEEELKNMLKLQNIKENDMCLILGLGNEKSTPDSLGPLVVSETLVTNYIYLYGSLDEGYRRVCAIAPGVMGETGIETSDLLKSIVNEVKPDFVITIDALAASSVERVNKTIQMTDSGINPGSGVGNKRKEISKEVLGIKTIAIGIPTVVDAASIVSDTINYLYKHFAYQTANLNNPASKLTANVNYLKLSQDFKINKEEKEKILGMVGTLSEQETKDLIYEILNPIGYNLMVTPKEEDFVIAKLAEVLSAGLNNALHQTK